MHAPRFGNPSALIPGPTTKRDLTPATACTCFVRPRHVPTWTLSFIYFSLSWTRAFGPTKRGRRGATLSAHPDANEGCAPRSYRFCAPLLLIHMPLPTLKYLERYPRYKCGRGFLIALNSCILLADLHLQDFQRLHLGADRFPSVIVRKSSTGWDVGRQSFQYRLRLSSQTAQKRLLSRRAFAERQTHTAPSQSNR